MNNTPGMILTVDPDSVGATLGLQPGDAVLTVNGHAVEDVIDAQFYAAEDDLTIEFSRAGATQTARGPRAEGQALGLTFTHPTFDIDIRRCNNLCPFCFVLQTAPRMRRALYIKDDDYRYSFLYGHFVTLTNLSARDWERIAQQRLSPLYVSVHSTDLENRRACLANPTAPDILEQLHWLAERRIEVHTQIVLTPGLNDGAFLEKSVRDLAELYPTVASVSLVPVGLTRHHKYGHRPHTRAEAEAVLDRAAAWQKEFQARWGVRFVYPTDEWYLVTERRIPPRRAYDDLALQENGLGLARDFLDEWGKTRRAIKRRGIRLVGRKITLATATLFAPTLQKTAAEFAALTGADVAVVPVVNARLGETITVAGLLMGADVAAQLPGRDLGEAVILPRVMFDHPQGISLDDVSPLMLARQLQRPVYLADALGDVLDALLDVNPLRFDPDAETIPPEVMRAGGWAVEKYL